MDKYVLDIPWPIRFGIVYGTILPTRPKETTKAYKKIWTNEGSPLIALSKQLQQQVQSQTNTPIYLAMRYENPSIKNVLKHIQQKHPHLSELTLLPLYPHFAWSSTLTAINETKKWAKKLIPQTQLSIIESFYNHPEYITNLANSIKPFITKNVDKLMFSYHGLPERHIKKSDCTKTHCLTTKNCCTTKSKAWNHCYRHQCFETTKLVSKQLNLSPEKIIISFQSRLGKDPWLQPNTEEIIISEAKKNTKNLCIVSPSFVTDCLETLEELNIRARNLFLDNGGQTFTYIPCLNTQPGWVSTVTSLIQKQAKNLTQKR